MIDERDLCRYFTHYGNHGVPGVCNERATLIMDRLHAQRDIRVCEHHALMITARFPLLGTVEQRFSRL